MGFTGSVFHQINARDDLPTVTPSTDSVKTIITCSFKSMIVFEGVNMTFFQKG